MAALEEEEEVGRSRDHTTKKRAHMYHPSVISFPWSFGGVVHNLPRVARIFCMRWVVCCYKATNSKDRVLNTDWELPTIEILRVAHKFLAVVLESPYTQFLSSPPINLASIHKSGSKPWWVEGSSLYLSLNRLLYVSWNKKRYHQIQFKKIIT